MSESITPGPIVLFGSGETSPSGRKVFDSLLHNLPPSPRVTLLETPAGFELNSAQVIGRVGEFISFRLQNYQPRISYVPARMRGTSFSPDDPELIEPLYQADLIFMGPGSPTYAVRQLRDSLAWYAMLARHRLGAAIALASAAVVAVSAYCLPVYEIYKVGEDLHWKDGLNLFGYYGLPLVFVPHWNNNDGGEELDTSRCFMGQPRFARLMEMLEGGLTVVGIEEKTALVVYPADGTCQVVGLGGVTLIHTGQAIGNFHAPPPGLGLPDAIWQHALDASAASPEEADKPSRQVMELVREREAARQRKDWQEADRLRKEISAGGWQVQDTPDGPRLEQIQAGNS